MATIAKMVIAGIVDPTGVKQGLAASLSELQKFKRVASKRIDMELAFPDLKKAEAAQKLLSSLQKSFDAAMSDAKFDLGTEKIKTKDFNKLGIQAKKDFNAGLGKTIENLDKAGLLTPQIYKALTDQFKKVGDASGNAFGKAASRGAAAHPLLGNLTTTGQRAANTLLNGLNRTYQARVNDLREQFANKLITVQQFRRKGQEAADEFDKGITAGLAKLRSKNQATGNITAALVDSYKLAGTKAANQFQFSLDKQLGENISRIGSTMTAAVTVPVVAATAAAVKLGADFELAMNRIRAILQPTEEDMAKLATQARNIGLETKFSSNDAAQAQAKLAQQLGSATKVLAAIPAVTKLAAAGLIDMTTAADIGAGIVYGFGQSIESLDKDADILVGLTNIARTDLNELADAFKYVGPNAVQAGQSFETIAAALGAMSARNIKASMGGTALRGILARLVNPTKKASEALDILGISLFDSQHKMRDLIDIVGQFEAAQKRFNPEAFQKLVGQVFQQRTGTGFNALLQTSTKGLEEMRKKLTEMGGTAQRVADVQMKGASGSFEFFKSSVQELGIAVANSGILKFVGDLARTLANMINALAQSNPGFLKWATYLALIAATIGPILFSFGKFITLAATMRAILVALNGSAALAGLGAALATGGAILVGLGLLAAIFVKVAADAANAKAKIEEFRSSLTKKTVDELESMKADIDTSISFNTKLLAKLRAAEQKSGATAFFAGKGLTSQPGSQLQKVSDLLKEQQRMLDDVNKALDSARKSAAELGKAGKVTTDLPQGDETGDLGLPDTSKVDKTKTALEQLAARVKLLIDYTGTLDNKIAGQPKLVDALSKAWSEVGFWVLQSGDDITETGQDLLKMRKDLEEVFKNVDVILPKMTEDQFRKAIGADKPLSLQVVPILKNVTFVTAKGPLEKAVEQFEKAANDALSSKLDLDLLGKTKNLDAVKGASATYAAALAKAKVAETTLATVIRASNLPLQEKEELIKKIEEAMGKLDKQQSKTAKRLSKLATSLQGMADAVRGIRNIAEAFGEMSEGAASALDATTDLLSSLSNLTQSIASGDVFGAISSAIGSVGALIKLGQSLFGKNPNDQKNAEIFRSNTAALSELKRSIDAWAVTVSVIGRAQPVIDATIKSIQAALAAVFNKVGSKIDLKNVQFKSVEEFDKQLRAAGSSFEEIQAIAKELNIDLFNAQGRLSAAGLEALTKAMDLQRQKLTQFGKSLDDVRNRMELKRNVFNLDTSPVAELQQNIDLLKQFAPGIANMFTGFNAATDQGRAMIEKALQNLFTMLEQKMIDPSMFSDISFEDLTGIIGNMADALDTFREKTEEATKDIVNVPSGFKIARYQFQARLDEAAKATQAFAQRVDTVTPTDASPIQQLMTALTGLVPKVNDAKLPDLKPLNDLMAGLGTVAGSELPALSAAINSVTQSAPTWGELPSVQPIQDVVTGISDSGTAVSEALTALARQIQSVSLGAPTIDPIALTAPTRNVVSGVADAGTAVSDALTGLAERIQDLTVGAPTVDPSVVPDLTGLADMVAGFTTSGTTASGELDALAASVRAAREAIAGGTAIPVTPPDMTPLTNLMAGLASSGGAARIELDALALTVKAAREAIAGGSAIPVTPPDMTPLTNVLTNVSAAGLTATVDLNAFSTAVRNATAAVGATISGGAAAAVSPSATVIVRDNRPVAPEPVSSQAGMTLIIQANVQQTQDPEDWYAGVKRVAKDKVRAKYGATAVTRVEENMP